MANDDYREQHEAAREVGLAARHETRVERAILRNPWIAQPNDLIGGWCVTLAAAVTPAQGNDPVADFCSQEVAGYIARIHNAHLGRFGLAEKP